MKTFISQSQVVIKFEMEGRGKELAEPDRLLTVRYFAEYYKLVRRLSDLLTLACAEQDGDGLTASAFGPAGPFHLAECVICYTEKSSSILPCNHRICESCESRWVRKRLQCPFCRTSFKSVKQIQNCAWNLSEFSSAEVHKDIDELWSKLEEFWTSCGYLTTLEDRMALFEPVKRQIKMTKDDVGWVVSNT